MIPPDHMQARTVTRGHGLLEDFLAARRRSQAERLIPEQARSGRILDIGCGSFPTFLQNIRFGERYGLDRLPLADQRETGVTLVNHDVVDRSGLPFEDAFFDVVTMLAVFEHIETAALKRVLADVYRLLSPGGLYVMTTPARWTEGILTAMAGIGLVSVEEVSEHKAQYSRREIMSLLLEAGFERSHIRQGAFELGVNLWATAQKSG
jgi:SAM-dependent methyltransferase